MIRAYHIPGRGYVFTVAPTAGTYVLLDTFEQELVVKEVCGNVVELHPTSQSPSTFTALHTNFKVW